MPNPKDRRGKELVRISSERGIVAGNIYDCCTINQGQHHSQLAAITEFDLGALSRWNIQQVLNILVEQS